MECCPDWRGAVFPAYGERSAAKAMESRIGLGRGHVEMGLSLEVLWETYIMGTLPIEEA